MATMTTSGRKLHQRIRWAVCSLQKDKGEVLHLRGDVLFSAALRSCRTASRYAGNFPTSIACLISRMMSR